MKEKITECPKCKSKNVVFQDDSFNHEFGNEVIQYYYCEDCNWQE